MIEIDSNRDNIGTARMIKESAHVAIRIGIDAVL